MCPKSTSRFAVCVSWALTSPHTYPLRQQNPHIISIKNTSIKNTWIIKLFNLMKNLKRFTLVRHLSREKSTLRKTALWQLHKGTSLFHLCSSGLSSLTSGTGIFTDLLWTYKDLKATMGPFAGWDMPMIYKGVSIPDSVKVSLIENLYNL